jgi:hypothetical protein
MPASAHRGGAKGQPSHDVLTFQPTPGGPGPRRRLRIVPLLPKCDAKWLSPAEDTTLGGCIVVGVWMHRRHRRWASDGRAVNQGVLTGAAVETVRSIET